MQLQAAPWLRSARLAPPLHPAAGRQRWESDTGDNVPCNESLIKREVLRGDEVPIKLNSVRPVLLSLRDNCHSDTFALLKCKNNGSVFANVETFLLEKKKKKERRRRKQRMNISMRK